MVEIHNISEFKEILENKKEIKLKKEIVNDQEFSIISYMIETPTTFDSELARECRGIVFNAEGEIVCRPLHKFFNIGQHESSKPENIDFNNISYIGNKFDGSMINIFKYGRVPYYYVKTKKSFYTEQAIASQKLINVSNISEYGYTDIWEYVVPSNQIVLNYDADQLIYLHSRENISGKYFSPYKCDLDISKFKDIYELVNYVSKMQNIEGFVIYDGKDFYKIKTEWYLERHKARNTISAKDVIDLILDDKLDDVIGTLAQYGYQDRINELGIYQKEITSSLLDIIFESEQIYKNIYKGQNKKQFAFDIKKQSISNRCHSILFNMFDNTSEKTISDSAKRIIRKEFYEKYKGKLIGGI
jgi:RNA ligase